MIAPLGRWMLGTLELLGSLVRLLFQTLYHTRVNRESITLLVHQIAYIGTQSLLVISVTAFFTGGTLALQVSRGMEPSILGVNLIMGNFVGLALFRELGPVLTSLLTAGKAGSAIAAEIGSMKVSEQIDALKTLGISPFRI